MTLIERIASRRNAWKVEELAKELNCSADKLYRMVHNGRIPAIKIGAMIRFDPQTTAAWLEGKKTFTSI